MTNSSPPPMVVYDSLDTYLTIHRRMTVEDRAAVSHRPVILGLLSDAQRDPAQGFHTKFDDTPVGRGAFSGVATTGDLLVIPVMKRKEGPFQERIGVGRTRTTDICLLYNGVSKYHAFFTVDENGVVSLTDADSKNGTTVDGTALTTRIPHRLVDRCVVCFGSAHFRFHTSEGFRRLIESMI